MFMGFTNTNKVRTSEDNEREGKNPGQELLSTD
jgi:hypothetical protein